MLKSIFSSKLWVNQRCYLHGSSQFKILTPFPLRVNSAKCSLDKLQKMSHCELKVLAKFFNLLETGKKAVVLERLSLHWRKIAPTVLTSVQMKIKFPASSISHNQITQKIFLGLESEQTLNANPQNIPIPNSPVAQLHNTYLQYKHRSSPIKQTHHVAHAHSYEVKLNGHGVSYRYDQLQTAPSTTYRSARYLPLDQRERVRVEMRRHLLHRQLDYVLRDRQRESETKGLMSGA